jgi:hypothetical protein
MAHSKNPNLYFRGMKFSASKMSRLHPQDAADLAQDTRERLHTTLIKATSLMQSRRFWIAPVWLLG